MYCIYFCLLQILMNAHWGLTSVPSNVRTQQEVIPVPVRLRRHWLMINWLVLVSRALIDTPLTVESITTKRASPDEDTLSSSGCRVKVKVSSQSRKWSCWTIYCNTQGVAANTDCWLLETNLLTPKGVGILADKAHHRIRKNKEMLWIKQLRRPKYINIRLWPDF